MDARTVRDTIIKPKLAEVFGTTMTNALITTSIAAGIGGGTEQEKLKLMVESICSDPQVLSMWGAALTEKQKQAWLSAL